MHASATPTYLDALRSAHTAPVRMEVYRGGIRIDDDSLIVTGGSVKADRDSKVRRTCSVELANAPGLWELLVPSGTEIRLFRGVATTSKQVAWTPLGVFVVDTQSSGYDPEGTFTLNGGDRYMRVQEAMFLRPRPLPEGQEIRSHIQTLVTEIVAVSTVNTASASYVLGAGAWEGGRDTAVETMNTAIGVETFFDADGSLIVRDIRSVTDQPVWTVAVGAGGVLLTADRERTRRDTFNVVVASTGKADGSAVFDPQIVWDNDPNSDTYAGPDPLNNPAGAGPFGVKPTSYESELLASPAHALTAAAGVLKTTLGLAAQLTITSVVNPALEPGDTISVVLPPKARYQAPVIERHIVDSVTTPLSPDTPQVITTRSTRPAG